MSSGEIDCPECGAKSSVSLYADAIVQLDMEGFRVIETNVLDNSWLACGGCFATSEKNNGNSDKLWKIWKQL